MFDLLRTYVSSRGFAVAVLSLCVALLLPAQAAFAQSTATLTGTVTDASGAVLAGTSVICRNAATQVELPTVTNSKGLFRLPLVPVGTYDLTVSKSGFDQLVQHGIELLTEHTVDLTLVLRVGSSNETVSVTADRPLLQTTTSEVQTSVESRQIQDFR